MKIKDFVTRLSLGGISPQQQKEFEQYLESNDDVAAKLCEYDFPGIIGIICNNSKLYEKEYAFKYRYVKPLYISKKIDIEHYIQHIFVKNEKDTIKYISENQLELIIESYKAKNSLIESYRRLGNSITKTLKNKEDKKKNDELVNKDIAKLRYYLGNPEDTLGRLLDVKKKYNENQALKQSMFYEDSISRIDYSKDEQQEMFEIIEHLKCCIEQLENENYQLKMKFNEAEQCLENLKESKKVLETENFELLQKLEKVQDDREFLVSNCKEYEGMVTKLSGQIVNALYKPLSDLERIVFEIEDSNRNPNEISEWLKEPLDELWKNFECIKLNNENLTELPAHYMISLETLTEYEQWANKVPVKFDDSIHFCELNPTEYVLLRTRGVRYIDNLSRVRVNKAEVIPYMANSNDNIDVVGMERVMEAGERNE